MELVEKIRPEMASDDASADVTSGGLDHVSSSKLIQVVVQGSVYLPCTLVI